MYVLHCDKPMQAQAWPRVLTGFTVVFNYTGEAVLTGEVNTTTEFLFKVGTLL